MKKKYSVRVYGDVRKDFEVEAESSKEAEEIVELRMCSGEYDLTGQEVSRLCFYSDDLPDDPDRFDPFRVWLSVTFTSRYDSCVLKSTKGDWFSKTEAGWNDAKRKMLEDEFYFGFLRKFEADVEVSGGDENFQEDILRWESSENKRRFLTCFRNAIDKTLENWPKGEAEWDAL